VACVLKPPASRRGLAKTMVLEPRIFSDRWGTPPSATMSTSIKCHSYSRSPCPFAMLPGHSKNPTKPFQCAGCGSILRDTTIQRTSGTGGYKIYYPGNRSKYNCDGVTDCNSTIMNIGWVGDLHDCAALCANFAFTNFTSSTCYRALVYPGNDNCKLFLWNAKTAPSTSGAVVLSYCALHIQSVCIPGSHVGEFD
jgi:hypothetical protein